MALFELMSPRQKARHVDAGRLRRSALSLQVTAQLARRKEEFEPLTHALFVRKSGHSETACGIWRHVCI